MAPDERAERRQRGAWLRPAGAEYGWISTAVSAIRCTAFMPGGQ